MRWGSAAIGHQSVLSAGSIGGGGRQDGGSIFSPATSSGVNMADGVGCRGENQDMKAGLHG